MKAFLAILGVCLLSYIVHGQCGVMVCYYGAWANGRTGIGRFGVSDLEKAADLCTHIVYSFSDLTATGDITFTDTPTVVEGKSSTLEDFIALRKKYPDTKFILGAGGWNAGSEDFSAVVNNPTLRATYVKNVVTFLGEHGFDGYDCDWEYPNQRNGTEADRQGFVYLLQDLRAAFEEKDYYLSAACAVTQNAIDLSYLVPNITAVVDHVHLMTYDYHGSWDTVTGVNSPLHPQTTDAAGDVLNQEASVDVWIKNGADASKLVLGLGNYGRTFTLASTANVGTNAPATGAGAAGPNTAEAGTLAYYEICLDQKNNPDAWSITEVEGNYVYANKDLQWVGYDNVNTIAAKAKYAKEKGLGGIMFWAADLDDFSNQCGGGAYPLTSAAIKAFNAA